MSASTIINRDGSHSIKDGTKTVSERSTTDLSETVSFPSLIEWLPSLLINLWFPCTGGGGATQPSSTGYAQQYYDT
ncbi:hypothetical protein Tco_0476162 [Tanacetum coccineum]